MAGLSGVGRWIGDGGKPGGNWCSCPLGLGSNGGGRRTLQVSADGWRWRCVVWPSKAESSVVGVAGLAASANMDV